MRLLRRIWVVHSTEIGDKLLLKEEDFILELLHNSFYQTSTITKTKAGIAVTLFTCRMRPMKDEYRLELNDALQPIMLFGGEGTSELHYEKLSNDKNYCLVGF